MLQCVTRVPHCKEVEKSTGRIPVQGEMMGLQGDHVVEGLCRWVRICVGRHVDYHQEGISFRADGDCSAFGKRV